MSEILVGIDGSAGAQDALAFAKQLARVTGAGLRLANAFPYDDIGPARRARRSGRSSAATPKPS
jgi:nucleotide-binding universal stress UspA family protein